MDVFEELKNRIRSTSPQEMEKILSSADMPPEAMQAAGNRLAEVSGISHDSSEYEKAVSYLLFLSVLPWNRKSGTEPDLRKMRDLISAKIDCSEEQKNILTGCSGTAQDDASGSPKVMVVDDEKIALESLEYAMAGEGYDVFRANNGSEAIDQLRTHNFDIIITDLIMGDVDGNDILREVKSRSPRTKVIMVTGYATVDTAVEAMRKGAFHYIEKPLKLDELKKVVKEALKKRSSSEAKRVPCLTGRDRTARASVVGAFAEAAGRCCVRISLDEIRNEAELIGNTEGEEPGIIARELIRAGVSDPVFMLEGIDTAAEKFDGDLDSILIELVSPQTRRTFKDRYIKVPFDLSDGVFIIAADNPSGIGDKLKVHLEIIGLK